MTHTAVNPKQCHSGFGVPEEYSDYMVRDPEGRKIGRVKEIFANAHGEPQYVRVRMGFFGLRTVLTPVCFVRVLLLRVSRKRTLSKMNAFDIVVTVALRSTLATVLLSKMVALAEGVLAFAVLILLPFVETWVSVRSPMVRRLVKNEPRLLLYDGRFLQEAM